MSLITDDIKGLLSIKIKARHDDYTDQFNRIFMIKMLMVSSMLLGLNWLKDEITCIIPNTTEMDGSGKAYVHEACWVQGFYIYKELENHPGIRTYYGIPKHLEENGVDLNGNLCAVSDEDEKCKPMTKTFYLQYQWFPFFIAVVGVFYYLPYILFRAVNTDLISLKDNLKNPDVDADEIVENYFNYEINPAIKMRMRLVGNVCVKIGYILSNIVVFVATDAVINGDYKEYGLKWVKWGKQSNSDAYDYTSRHTKYRTGDKLLPTFGICEVLEIAKDVKHHLFNQHRFVCEISQNVLYQYVLIVLWFLFISGMLISCIGLVIQVVGYVTTVSSLLTQGNQARRIYKAITIRECEYLEFMRNKSLPVYGKVIRKLIDSRLRKSDKDTEYTPNHRIDSQNQNLLNETEA